MESQPGPFHMKVLDFGFSLEACGCSGVVFVVVFRALAEGPGVEGRVDAEGGGRTEVSSSVGPREKPASPTGTACRPDAMASNGSFPGPPGDGWQQRTLPMLAGLARAPAPYTRTGITAAMVPTPRC
jgi:hypothetical protein